MNEELRHKMEVSNCKCRTDEHYEELMDEWGWTFEQCVEHREQCAMIASRS